MWFFFVAHVGPQAMAQAADAAPSMAMAQQMVGWEGIKFKINKNWGEIVS